MPQGFVKVVSHPTGDKIHTRTYSINGDVVSDQYVIPVSARARTGFYRGQTGAHVVGAAADAATAGRWWLINPVGSTIAVAVKRVTFMSQIASAVSLPSSPRLQIERVTFTGTPTGAAVTPARRVRTAVAGLAACESPVASLRLASTGLVLTPGEVIRAFLPVALAGITGGVPVGETDWQSETEDEELILAAGEGIVFRQPDAGTVLDTRRYVTNVVWEEFSAP